MFTIIGKTNVDFVGKRYIGFVCSAVLMALGVWGIVRVGTGTAKMAIDFSGGTSMTVMLEKTESIEAMRSALSADFPDAEILQVENKPQYLIKIRALGQETGKTGDKVLAIIAKSFPLNLVKEKSSEEVGPAVSQKLRQQAFWAVAVAMFFITIYIAFRFDFRFSVGAFVATIHDVLAVLGIMVFLGRDFSLLIVTALLTLAGYSLTDTVVVFDRIRENMRLRRSDPFGLIVNDSINETLSRTLNTSATTLVVIVVLFFWGGEVVHDFALALMMGIVVGTYSSIMVASPLVLEWNLRSPVKR